MGGGGDGGIDQLEAVIAVGGGGLGGKSGFMHGVEEEVAGAVAGEHAAGAVGAVGRGGEADQEQAGGGRPEVGDRLGPVGPVGKGAAFFGSDRLAVLAQARTLVAGGD